MTRWILLALMVPLPAWARGPVDESAWPPNDFDCVEQTRDGREECVVEVSATILGVEEIFYGKLTMVTVQVHETRLGRAADRLVVRANIPNRPHLEPLAVGKRYDLHLHAHDHDLYVVHHVDAR